MIKKIKKLIAIIRKVYAKPIKNDFTIYLR